MEYDWLITEFSSTLATPERQYAIKHSATRTDYIYGCWVIFARSRSGECLSYGVGVRKQLPREWFVFFLHCCEIYFNARPPRASLFPLCRDLIFKFLMSLFTSISNLFFVYCAITQGVDSLGIILWGKEHYTLRENSIKHFFCYIFQSRKKQINNKLIFFINAVS